MALLTADLLEKVVDKPIKIEIEQSVRQVTRPRRSHSQVFCVINGKIRPETAWLLSHHWLNWQLSFIDLKLTSVCDKLKMQFGFENSIFYLFLEYLFLVSSSKVDWIIAVKIIDRRMVRHAGTVHWLELLNLIWKSIDGSRCLLNYTSVPTTLK